MTEKNPWSKAFWNLTNQARFLQEHGIEKAREAATEAGLDPDKQPGLAPRELVPQGDDAHSLLGLFTKKNAEEFEAKVKAYKPQAPPRPGLNYAGYMQRKRAGKLPGQA